MNWFDFILCPKAVKNPRENTRSPRTGHEMKRTYNMIEGSMGRGHSGREGAPFEGMCRWMNQMYAVLFVRRDFAKFSFRLRFN